MNAVMQCLTHTVPLSRLVMSGCHAKVCTRRKEGHCYLCTYDAFHRGVAEKGRVDIRPVIQKLGQIWHGYRLG